MARRRSPSLAGRKPPKKKRSVGRPDSASAIGTAEAPGADGHGMAAGDGGADQAIAGIGDQRHAGVGHQRHPLARGQRAHDARLGDVLGGVAVGHGGRGNAVVAGKLGEHAGVLAGDQVGRVQDVERTQA